MSRTPFTETKLDYTQQRALEVARVAFMTHAPFYAHLYHSIGKEVISKDIKTLATDGRHIVINPEYFTKLIPSEQVAALAHEMAHLVGRHPQRLAYYQRMGELRGKPVSRQFANIVADYVINADLLETKVGSINPNWLLHKDVHGGDLWEEVYERMWKDPPSPPPPPPGGGDKPCPEGQPGPGGQVPSNDPPPPDGSNKPEPKPEHTTQRAKDTNQRKPGMGKPDKLADENDGAFDELLPPPVNPVTGELDLPDENEFKEAVARAFAVAKATTMGDLPASIKRLVDEILTPQVNWREHIRMLVTGKIGARGETWKRPNRRRLALNPIMILPGKRGYGAELVVVGIDTSGSVDDKQLAVYLNEVGGILNDVKPRRIVVIGCDAEVSQVDELTTLDDFEGLKEKGVSGGGGTDFRPVFEHISENNLRPDAMIYCTDMQGRFPEDEPAYPVIWAATTDEPAPWGEVVRINPEG